MAEGDPSTGDIEVDDAAAYFGVTESSDILHAMMAMTRQDAMVKFFDFLSDIVLQPGDFDFEAASERMACEGGEIYYLVAGHLGLMSMPDPLLDALGEPNSSGEASGPGLSGLTEDQRTAISALADPMRMMKLFAVAHQTGGADEVLSYLNNLDRFMSDVASSAESWSAINRELTAALDVAGHVLPIATLGSGAASATTIEVTATVPPPAPQPVEPVVEPAPPSAVPSPSPPPPVDPEPTASSTVPLPGTEAPSNVAPLPAPAAPSGPSVALPDVPVAKAAVTAVNLENEKQAQRAAQDAFAGAFDMELTAETAAPPVQPETLAPVEEEEEFVSAAEHFIAADEDGSGALSVEELAQATGTTVDEAKELHAEADVDGDGSVTLSEFMASSAAEKTVGLPRPVAPVRKPLGAGSNASTAPTSPPAPAPSAPTPQGQPMPQPQPGWQQQGVPRQGMPQQGWQTQPQQPMGWPQQPPMQPGWPQPQGPVVQPTIRSGVHCRGCGIGLDPYWRFCPVCGQQNLGY